jgi:hypothetical protein
MVIGLLLDRMTHGTYRPGNPHASVSAEVDGGRRLLRAAPRAMLEARGNVDVQDAIVARARETLLAADGEPRGFAVTRPYFVAVAQRS